MVVTVPATLESFVQSQLQSGAFSSMEEVVEAGLELLRRQEETWKAAAREKIDEGWCQARAGESIGADEARALLGETKATWKQARR